MYLRKSSAEFYKTFMAQKNKRKVDNLSRLLNYILGSKPDEFGLVPDKQGYIVLRELLKAINEEPSMAYVKEFHIREVLVHKRDSMLEITGKKIRSTKRNYSLIDKDRPPDSTPKILYKGVKRKTYPFILKSGLLPGSNGHVVMTKDRDLAMRIGRRLDQRPIIIEIQAGAASEYNTIFLPFGDSMYLTDKVSAQFINGPPLPKEPSPKKKTAEKEREFIAGSFILKTERDPDLKRRKNEKKQIVGKERVKKRKRKPGGIKNMLQFTF